ncbi:MAG: glycosyltransferase family 4 protein [Actinomycetota bacterium]
MSAIPITFVSSHSANGGSERYLRRLITELGSDWVKDIICLQDGWLAETLRADGRDVTVIDMPTRPPGLLTRSMALRRHLRSTSATLVHANGIKAAFACGIATMGTRIKVVWVKHDFSFEGAFASAVGAAVDRTVGVSKASISQLRGPAVRKATYVHTGIDHVPADRSVARRALLEQMRWPDDSFVIGAVGRLDPTKGFAELIRAAAIVRTTQPATRVVVAGSPDPHHPQTRSELERIARDLGLADKVTILGEQKDVRSLMAAFDLGVIPTVATRRGGREGFSLVALEMLDAGTPVVAFESGALPEVLGPCGILVTEGSVDALAAAIRSVAEDKALGAGLTDCGRDRVASFSTTRWIDEMKREYGSVKESPAR